MTNPAEIIIEPNRSWWRIDLKEVWAYRDLLWNMVRRDFVTRYRQTVLGPIWYIIQPLMTTLVFTVIFGRLAGISTDGLPRVLFYMTSLLGWNYFSRAFGDISNALVANQAVFSKVYFPRLIIPISKLFTNLFAFAVQLITLIAFIIYFKCCTDQGTTFHANPKALLFLPLVLIYTGLLAMGCGLLVASCTARYRDFLILIPFLTQLWMYLSAVIFPLSIIPERWQFLTTLNPIVPLLEWFRLAFLGTGTLTTSGLVAAALSGAVLTVVGIFSFQRTARNFIDSV